MFENWSNAMHNDTINISIDRSKSGTNLIFFFYIKIWKYVQTSKNVGWNQTFVDFDCVLIIFGVSFFFCLNVVAEQT